MFSFVCHCHLVIDRLARRIVHVVSTIDNVCLINGDRYLVSGGGRVGRRQSCGTRYPQ